MHGVKMEVGDLRKRTTGLLRVMNARNKAHKKYMETRSYDSYLNFKRLRIKFRFLE